MFHVAGRLAARCTAAGDDRISRARAHPRFAGQAIAALLLTLLVATSFSPLSTAQGSADQACQAVGQKAAGHGAEGRGHWDWGAYADESGSVDAIIWADSSLSLEKFKQNAKKSFNLHIKGTLAAGEELTVSGTPEALDAVLAADPALHAYPDMTVTAMDGASLDAIGAPQIWNRTDSSSKPIVGTGVVVAVIDTGICYTHPDLGGGIGPGHKVIGGFDFYNNDPDPMDDNGHGTHVAGIIAADGGLHGVAPGASLLAYKALGADGSGSMSLVAKAVDTATDPNGDGDTSDHVDIISMSLGGSGDPDDPICRAVERATNAGVLVVVAAGNSGPSVDTVASPGVSPLALTVGAVDDTGILANFSSRGPTSDLSIKPEISAPGVSVLSTVPYSGATRSSPTGYMEMSGTSMATPHVSGAAALVLQLHPSWTPEHVKAALISGAKQIGESLWSAGAGMLWLPASMDIAQYSDTQVVSYGVANGTVSTISVTNSGASGTFSVRSVDWHSLSADGTVKYHDWTNVSSVSPSSVTMSSLGTSTITLTVNSGTQPEGYYDGAITLTSGSATYRIPFGFLILTRVTIHVIDTAGREVYDPYGGVWLYSLPYASTAIGKRGGDEPAPPATFLVPSGSYQVHALGHQLVYSYGDAYILSATFTLARLETKQIYLRMADAHEVSIDLETKEGLPIYVKEYRSYVRYAGEGVRNVSFDLTGTDYSITGSGMFTIPHSMLVYVTDTSATVGISVTGYAYTKPMWDFMQLNWQHWYEYISSSSTAFMIESTTDLQYMLAWEFNGVGASMPPELTYDPASCTVLETKYDIAGTIKEPWCNWGSHRAIGGESVFYTRRDTETSLNPFFSGLTRTSIVNGIFSELYFPRGVFQGFVERSFYVPDYTHVLRAHTASEVYLPDRNYLDETDPLAATQRIGQGPFYPSVYTANTNDSLIMFHPLLRDQYGSKVDGIATPTMRLTRNGFAVGIYQISEYQARPDAKRVVPLMGSGSYVAKIDYTPFAQLYNLVTIELGFTVPAPDTDPPVVTGMSLPQRFTPGNQLQMSISASDESSPVTVTMSSRAGYQSAWTPLTVSSASGVFTSTIKTTSSTSVIDIKFRVTDASGNYIDYTAYNASWAETSVQFSIGPVDAQVEYRTTGVTVGLTGYLKDASGGPIDDIAGVPLEIRVGSKKVGIVLDEYMASGTHTHNGTIAFDWTVRPTDIFTGPGQAVTVTVDFDLGTYQRVTRSFTLTSIANSNTPPTIGLVSPTNDSTIASGTKIDLSIADDGPFSAGYSLDGGPFAQLSSPFDIDTSGWTDGTHVVRAYAVDDDLLNTTCSYRFDTDANPPQLSITNPLSGSVVPTGSTMSVSVSDRHLSSVVYHLDSGPDIALSSPYQVSMASWSIGTHTVVVRATDSVGHVSTATATFEIANSSVTVTVKSPTNGSVVRQGVPVELLVAGSGTLACRWSEGGIAHSLTSPFSISTADWTEGTHVINITATNSLGGSYSVMFTLTIDNTPPKVTLVSPTQGTYVDTDDVVLVRASDDHYKSVSWTVGGMTYKSNSTTAIVLLNRVNKDGQFTVNVTAADKANNTASTSFVFLMDCSWPVITFGGVSTTPIAAGAGLNVSAHDAYLVSLALGIDGGTSRTVTSPYEIDTSKLASGWHVLAASATDRVGHLKCSNITIYVDASPPVVSLGSLDKYVDGSSMVVTATASDDSNLSGVVLFYVSKSGDTFGIQMSASNGKYTATLSPSELWDGITVYAVATDVVGHSTETSHFTLTASGVVDDGDSGGATGTISSTPASPVGIVSSVSLALAVPLLAFFILRRRKDSWEVLEDGIQFDRKDLRKEDEGEEGREPRFDELERLSTFPRPLMASDQETPEIERDVPLVPAPFSEPPTSPPKPSQPSRAPVKLIDAIPEMRFSEDETEEEYEAFMHEIEDVQKQMVGMAEKRSIYHQPEDSSRPDELGLDLDEFKPKRISGLQLKKSME